MCTNEQGQVVEGFSYSPFGELLSENESGITFLYNGEFGIQTDEESGMLYMRARYYHPQLSRFISEDPIKDGLNWYCFADNNPIKYLDPTGEFAITLTIILVVTVATAATYVASTIIHNYLDSPQGQAAVQSAATGIQNTVAVTKDFLTTPIFPVPGNKEWTKGVNGIPANRRNAEGNTVFTPPGRIVTGNFITMPEPRSIQDSLEILVPPPINNSLFTCKSSQESIDVWNKIGTNTNHGKQRLTERGFSDAKVKDIIENYSQKVYQSGGKTVYAKKNGNYYDVIITNSKGEVITAVGGNTKSLSTWKDVTKMLNNNGGYSSLPIN